MKKDTWEPQCPGTRAVPPALTMGWEARAGILRDAPLRASLVFIETRPYLS